VSPTDQAWPFDDADRNHPLAARRVPVIATWHPDWRYEVALCVGSMWATDSDMWAGDVHRCVEPTALEADLIVACIEKRMEYYNDGWKARMRERALDVDSSTNTVIFGRTARIDGKPWTGGWKYRRDSWEHGPFPFYDSPQPVMSLPEVIDHCWRIGDGETEDFTAWKARHADLISAVRAEWSATQAETQVTP
jgi:hypothetical protein